ncbi:hypothetical protein [Bifidobacterium jacchi]|uniref:hypothetical protein n=1 Tax=Bifidobacterium jacchi TaxID=2490545 RepID=UPI0015880F37|nr:hypothetical protein [Bifidobacterium jacchi]
MGTTTGFTPDEWLGDWISFERLIDGREPELERAWRDSEQAMRGGRSVFAVMRLLFGGSMRRFWRWACRTASRENRTAVVRWHIEPLGAQGTFVKAAAAGSPVDSAVAAEHSEAGDRSGASRRTGFSLEWFGPGDVSLGRFDYVLAYVIDKGLEGKPCYVFRASDAPAGCPFAVLIAMDPMPERSAYASGGLLAHLHFQYGSSERRLLRGTGASARLRHRMWYPTMCDATGPAHGDQRAWAAIVRSLHGLPVAPAARSGHSR